MQRALLIALLALAPLPATAGEWGGLFSAVTLTSDYRFQGVSSTGGKPAMQGYVHYWRPDGWYAGVFATQVDYGYPGAPTWELDSYAGKNLAFDKGRTELKLEAMYSSFPDNQTWGPTLDFLQLKVQATRRLPRWTLSAATAVTPEASYRGGEAWLVQADAVYEPEPWLKLKAGVGSRWADRSGADRTFWNAGVAATWKTVTFELRYEATDLSESECIFSAGACAPGLIGQVTVALPPVL